MARGVLAHSSSIKVHSSVIHAVREFLPSDEGDDSGSGLASRADCVPTASLQQGRLLNQRHCSVTPRSRGRPADYLPSGTVGQWPPATGQWWNVRRGGDPKTDQVTQEAVSVLPGWQPKETASQLPQGWRNSQIIFEGPRTLASRRHWLLQVVAATACVWWTAGLGRSSFLSSSTVASFFARVSSRKTSTQRRLLGSKKQRVVHIVTVACLATAGLRGGEQFYLLRQSHFPPLCLRCPPGFKTERRGWHHGRSAGYSVGAPARSRTCFEMGLPFHFKL